MSPGTVTLTPVAPRHADELQRLLSDPEVGIPANFPHPLPPGLLRKFARATRDEARRGCGYAFAAFAGATLVGGCGFHSFSTEGRTAELAFWIGRPYWGLGLGSAAVEQVLAFGFGSLHLEVVAARCLEWNTGALRVLALHRFELVATGRDPHVRTDAPVCRLRLPREVWEQTSKKKGSG